jgi:hypothetical protein
VVNADGSLQAGSPGVSSQRLGTGRYLVSFGTDVRACAPVASVDTAGDTAVAAQAYLAWASDDRSVVVAINSAHADRLDAPFSIVVTCSESPHRVYAASDGFYNRTTVVDAKSCAFTASWINTTPGADPSNQGYVSTWYLDNGIAVVQTKNGGYGVAVGHGVDLVATC